MNQQFSWPMGMRDMTEFPKVEVRVDVSFREHLAAFCKMDGLGWNDYDEQRSVGNLAVANSRITFTLQDSEGKVIKTKLTEGGYRIPAEDGTETFITDANGKAVFKYLKAGKYKLVETVPVGYIADGTTESELTDKHSEATPCKVTVNNCPTGIKIIKLDAKTNKPLTGAGFSIKVKDGLGFETLTFTKQADGKYFFDEKGTVMDLMVDKNGEVVILGLPMGAIWIEESVVPTGYFPVTARKAEITKESSAVKPIEIKVPNNRSVKLGLDNDWWELPAMIAGAVLLLGGAVFFIIKRTPKPP